MNRRIRRSLSALAVAAVLLEAAPAFAEPPAHSAYWQHRGNLTQPARDADGHGGGQRGYYARDYDEHDRHDQHRDWDDRGRGWDPHRRDWDHDRDDYRAYRQYDDDRHYYPRRGYVVERLPRGCRVVHFHGDRYYYDGGAWYQPYGPRFVVVAPPVGLTVSFLPNVYTTVWFGNVPYYYANSAYYVWRPDRRAYVVSESPYRR